MLEIPTRQVYTVSELTRKIRLSLEEEFLDVWVEGEISNQRTPTSGHTYLTLKDEESQLKAVIFKGYRRYLRFQPEDGLNVVAKGRLTVYEPRGEYQLVIEYLEPKGIGSLQLAFEQLKERLYREGLFDEAHKKRIPLLPEKIGVITSPTGAAIRDILQILERRFANIHLLLCPVRVQGDGAAEEIAQAIRVMDEQHLDVMIVGRGGGSLEDLWAFNEEVVARAIFEAKTSVISAVGHEIDYTIADFVADLRAPTPSAAAELVIQSKEELLQRLNGLRRQLTSSIKATIAPLREELRRYLERRVLADPRESIYRLGQRVDDLQNRLERGMRHELTLSSKNFETLTGKLDALSPLAILGRGYSICRRLPSLAVVRETTTLSVGEMVNVKLQKGEITCQVSAITSEER
ncbi:MAG: exodeoxyribonuclease VII large subunit [Candidatus Tectomicrobia bacterium]|nr:exodeoxyribonuclease VII large subunit [Candidatus Tectomicrobia bacterium]